MSDGDLIWSQKGATMSDKSARQEFGLTQQEIIAAIRAGKLQFRESNMHGNPWYRLLRQEVESLVRDKWGLDHLSGMGFFRKNHRKILSRKDLSRNDASSILTVDNLR